MKFIYFVYSYFVYYVNDIGFWVEVLSDIYVYFLKFIMRFVFNIYVWDISIVR